MKILHLLPGFEYSSASRQVAVLASALRALPGPSLLPDPAPVWDLHAAAPGPPGPAMTMLESVGVTVHGLGHGRRFALSAAWQLRSLIGELQPAVVHAWRLPAWRGAAAAPQRRSGVPLIVSQPFRGGRWTPMDRWLLGRAARVVAATAPEADAIRALDVSFARVATIPLAVERPPDRSPPADWPLPDTAQAIVCVGSLTPSHGFRDAVWAFDILRYLDPNLHLLIVGDGSGRAALERFVESVGLADRRVHILPARPNAAALIARAQVVWVPSRIDCGHQVALEALAAGRPVVAIRQPGLATLIVDGQTGLIVPASDPVALVRATRRFLEDPALAERLGTAGRRAATEQHDPATIAARWAELYGVCRSSRE